MKPIRAMIVDDSPTMRAMVAHLLTLDPGIEVVGAAAEPAQARAMIKELNPDVLTLDIEMPGMNGIDFLEKIMTLRPMPVVMVSTLTQRGAEATIRALELGAFDCYAKPQRVGSDGGKLASIVRHAATSGRRGASLRLPTVSQARAATPSQDYRPAANTMIAVGSSTGGVEALLTLFRGFPANCPPTVVVQHFPAGYTTSFAQRLDRSCAPTVVEAQNGMTLMEGHIYIAPSGPQHTEVIGTASPRLRTLPGDPVSGHRPSVDVLFRSVAKMPMRSVGVILTGMGQDGAAGLLDMRRAGARTIGQDEASCVVYGMPNAAHAMGAVEKQLPLGQIAERALELCRA
ncbi:protein-glutamate methylesterase/protein-glutamine glutaminase [Sphingomonas quercus]|uniref:Protein-glutamate methylesterase/protein-glutamine glutaminase n=1 Tax=Sphingomonas quercus TaxID=2842451 RepID=A0ABS6BFA3_9SPHN|nr:chemotaxis response regulator protein-glutamate methylesterase [Sphingomonas quercus]MBU3076512.1 chemotaxis response regulator protein-glutamate methylesterase [Sphingomonas quercus]